MPRRPAIADVLAAPAPADIPAVVARMEAVLAALPRTDGVAWFTRLYLRVTEAVAAELERGGFRDARFVAALDVAFANLFFAALAAHERDPRSAPRAWAPLVEARRRRGVVPLQFALAGMNAHINRDLPVALVETFRRLKLEPRARGVHHGDFRRVNAILAAVEEETKAELLTPVGSGVDAALGRVDDVVAMWNVERARDAAWVNGETLWALRRLPPLRDRFLGALDRMVGLAGRGLLRPVL